MARCGCGSTCSCLVVGDGTTILVTGNGAPGTPFTISATGSDTAVEELDTDSIDMTVAGTGTLADPYVISGEVVYSADAGNAASAGTDGGVFVAPSTATGTGFRPGAGTDSVIGGDLDTAGTATGTNSLAIGNGADSLANAALAVGPNSSADGIAAVAVGSQATTEDDAAVAVGQQATARNANDICIGHAAGTVSDPANGDNVVIGHSASADAVRSIAIGASAAVSVDDSAVMKADDFDLQPSSGAFRSNAHVRSSAGTKRRLATIIEEVSVVAATGATETVAEPETSSLNFWVLDANCTITFPALVAGKSFTLKLKQDATGSRTVTWPGTVLWPGGSAPTLTTTANKTDIFTFLCDGINWFGFVAGQNY